MRNSIPHDRAKTLPFRPHFPGDFRPAAKNDGSTGAAPRQGNRLFGEDRPCGACWHTDFDSRAGLRSSGFASRAWRLIVREQFPGIRIMGHDERNAGCGSRADWRCYHAPPANHAQKNPPYSHTEDSLLNERCSLRPGRGSAANRRLRRSAWAFSCPCPRAARRRRFLPAAAAAPSQSSFP